MQWNLCEHYLLSEANCFPRARPGEKCNLLETANVGQLSTHILKPDMIFPNSQISRFKAVTPSLNEVEWFEQFSNILNI